MKYKQLTQGVEQMQKQISNKIEKFAKSTGLTERVTISHGTLYALLLQPERCDFFHNVVRTFYKDNINPEGGVNMYAVGDEFAFDFVEGDKDNYMGVDMEDLTDDITEDAMNDMPSEVDIALNLESDSKEGR
jgi:hypothetical protein